MSPNKSSVLSGGRSQSALPVEACRDVPYHRSWCPRAEDSTASGVVARIFAAHATSARSAAHRRAKCVSGGDVCGASGGWYCPSSASCASPGGGSTLAAPCASVASPPEITPRWTYAAGTAAWCRRAWEGGHNCASRAPDRPSRWELPRLVPTMLLQARQRARSGHPHALGRAPHISGCTQVGFARGKGGCLARRGVPPMSRHPA